MSTPRQKLSSVESIRKASALLLTASIALSLFVGVQVFAATDTAEFTQEITSAAATVEVRDTNGATVPSPSVAFTSSAYGYSCDNNTASSTAMMVPNASERLYVENGGSTAFTVAIAPTATTSVWSDGGSNTFDFNDNGCTDGVDTDSVAGRLGVTVAGLDLTADYSGGNTTGLTAISADTSFVEGSADSITLLAATAAAQNGRWYLTDIGFEQVIPAGQAAANYTLDMTITFTAS